KRAVERAADEAFAALSRASAARRPGPRRRSVGVVLQAGDGVARVAGLADAQAGELLLLDGDRRALVYDLEPEEIGAILLDAAPTLKAGARVRPTGRVADTPVGPGLAGRIIDPLGRPLDGLGPVDAAARYPVEREARPIMARAPVTVPLATGRKAVGGPVPAGRGPRAAPCA